jgi:hypothetical protein
MEQHADELRRCMRLIQSEYREMPGLRLTRAQVQRLWSLDDRSCGVVLDALETAKFLKRSPRDAYVRADIGG